VAFSEAKPKFRVYGRRLGEWATGRLGQPFLIRSFLPTSKAREVGSWKVRLSSREQWF
jgi:hypothetical protein